MGGGGNGDSRRNDKMNTSDLVFILNPNRRPFLTPKFGVSDCMISSAFYQSHSQPQAYHALSAQEYQQLSPRGCQLNYPHEYQLNPPQEYQLNPHQEYQLNPPQEYQLNSPHGYQLNSSLTTDESISSMEIEESTFLSSDSAQPGYSSPPFPSKDDGCGVHLSYSSSSSPQKDESSGESLQKDDSGGESPQKDDSGDKSPQKDDSGGESPQKDDRCGESSQKDDRCGESPQEDDSDGDKHVPLAARRLMNHNKPGEKELLPRRRKQKRRIE